MMCICGGAGKIYAEREILLCFDERFPTGVIHTGFPYRQETAGERFPAAVMHYGLPYQQETLLQNVLTLVHYHLVLCEGNKKSLSAGKPTGFWREGKLLSRKSKVKMIRINAPPFLRASAIFPRFMGIWTGKDASVLSVDHRSTYVHIISSFSQVASPFLFILSKIIINKSCINVVLFMFWLSAIIKRRTA